MAASQKKETPKPRRRAATTPEERERQLSMLAYDHAEKQLRDGTASSQVTVHFLAAASSKQALERERMRMEIELGHVKKEALASANRVEELMKDALAAFKSYSPTSDDHDD